MKNLGAKSVHGKGRAKFRLGQKVQTKSGLVGKVIGYAEYWNGFTYRVKVPNKAKTMYRKEAVLKTPTKKKKGR